MRVRVYSRNNVTLRDTRVKHRQWMMSASLRAGAVIAIVVFGFLYVIQTNASSTKGYALSDLETRIRELEHETSRLDVEIASHQSIQSIEDRMHDTDLVAIDSVEYLTAVGSVVAQR